MFSLGGKLYVWLLVLELFHHGREGTVDELMMGVWLKLLPSGGLEVQWKVRMKVGITFKGLKLWLMLS